VFFAQVDGGRRGRFSYAFDPQHRIPVQTFGINGGEQGVIFAFEPTVLFNDVWMAFYSQDDYARRAATFSDASDLVDITHYQMDVDLKDPGNRLGVVAKMTMTARVPNLRAISFSLGEGLSLHGDDRLKKALRVKAARVGGVDAAAIQEDWESGFTVVLPTPAQPGETLTVDVGIEGDFLHSVPVIPESYYPLINTSCADARLSESLDLRHEVHASEAAQKGRHRSDSVWARTLPARTMMVTTYRMEQPIALAVFALGPFDRQRGTITFDGGGATDFRSNSTASTRRCWASKPISSCRNSTTPSGRSRRDVRPLSVPGLRRRVSLPELRPGVSVAPDDSAGGSRG
jgi:hypothetical protein